MNKSESLENKIEMRLEEEKEQISKLQERWDSALGNLYNYFDVENLDGGSENEKLRDIEGKTLDSIEKDKGPIILGFAGPGGAGKGTVRAQVKENLAAADIVNSTTRDKRDYEIDGVHYNFVTTEELARKTVLKEESLILIKDLLNLNDIPEYLQKEHLDKLQEMVDLDFKEGRVEDGIDLFPNVSDVKNEFLNLTLRPLRGWYALSIKDLKGVTSENSLASFEESGPNMLRIGHGINSEGINFYLVYVLPEQPIAKTMAARALKRDGYDQPTEKLLSTIGGRQVLEFEKMVEMLISGEYSTKLILLVNDEGYQKGDEFITRTGEALIDAVK